MDELLDDHQLERGGMLGVLAHLDDGDVPQVVEASVGSLNSVVAKPASEQRSMLESWVLGDWGEAVTAPGCKDAARDCKQGVTPELRALAEALLRLIGPITQEVGA